MYITGLPLFAAIAYFLLIGPIIYNLFKHGKHGALGYAALVSFCVVRIVGNIMVLVVEGRNGDTRAEAIVIVESIGISPLFLGTLGVLHEGRRARHQGWTSNRNLLEWACVILYHAFITLAVVLVIVGVITVENADGPPQPQHSVWLKVGISMVWVLWAVLVGWTIATLVSKTRELGSKKFHHGAVLAWATLAALVMIALRLIHGTVAFNLTSPTFAYAVGWLAGLQVVPEILLVFFFALAGVYTRNMWKGPSTSLEEGTVRMTVESPVSENFSQNTRKY